MRILHFVPDIGVANGVMSVVLNYFRAMPEDIKFDVMYFKECERDRRADIEALGGRVFKMNTPGINSFVSSELDGFFEEHRDEYAAVHIHAPYMTCLIAPKAKKHGIKKAAAHCHSTWYSLKPKNELRNRIFNVPTRFLADRLFACGRDAGRFWYGDDRNFTVLPNAVNCSAYAFTEEKKAAVRAEFGLTPNQLVIGHVGRVTPPQKNHPYLLRVFSEIKKLYPDAMLLMAGAEETDELRELAAGLGISDSARFLGRRSDIPQLLSGMDVFVFPSFKEGLPVSVVEAQAAGLPVLMSDTVTDEVCITDNIKRLSIEADPSEWAKEIEKVPDGPRAAAFEKVRKCGWDIADCANTLVEFYEG